MAQETELKFFIAPEQSDRLLRSKALKPYRQTRAKTRRQISTYFDTPRHVLREFGAALRVRTDGDSDAGTLTLKAPFAGPAGLQNHDEWSRSFDGGTPVLSELDLPGLPELPRRLRDKRYDRRLQPIFVTDVERRTLLLKNGGTEAELALDRGVIRAGDAEVPISEIEIELLSGDPADLLEIALDLCEAADMRVGHRTKADRGYALARPSLRPRPVKAPKVALSGDMTVGDALNAIMHDALDHLFANEEPTLAGQPEGVHQTRVAMRRIRAALRAFKKALPYDGRKAFNGEFRWFQQRMSPARDWHVFLSETVPHIEQTTGPRREIRQLKRLARTQRRVHAGEVADLLRSRRYARLILQFQRWIASLPQDGLDEPIEPFARRVLRRSRRNLLEEHRPLSRLASAELHRLRVMGKKLRYAGEFFSSLYDRPETKPFIKQLENIQDALGEANDAVVARHILATLKPGSVGAGALALVQHWSDDLVTHRVRAAQPLWRRFRAMDPFWAA